MHPDDLIEVNWRRMVGRMVEIRDGRPETGAALSVAWPSAVTPTYSRRVWASTSPAPTSWPKDSALSQTSTPRRFVAAWHTFNASTVRAAEDFADGKAGVLALVLGFGFQAAGYALSIGGVRSHTDGTRAAVIAIACTAAAIGIAYGFARLKRWPWTRKWLIEQACWEAAAGQLERHDYPDGAELMGYAKVLGKILPEEFGSPDDMLLRHARRVWKVDRVRGRGADGLPTVLGPAPETQAAEPGLR